MRAKPKIFTAANNAYQHVQVVVVRLDVVPVILGNPLKLLECNIPVSQHSLHKWGHPIYTWQ